MSSNHCAGMGGRRPEEVAEELPLPVLSRIQAEAATPFDLERGPLVRARLIRLAPEDHLLLLTMHHTIADGWSVKVRLIRLSHIACRFQACCCAFVPVADYVP